MDAISFVLGESTKNLRVKKLSVRINLISLYILSHKKTIFKFKNKLGFDPWRANW